MTKYVTNKASSNDFNKYINILGNDNSFLKKFNQTEIRTISYD